MSFPLLFRVLHRVAVLSPRIGPVASPWLKCHHVVQLSTSTATRACRGPGKEPSIFVSHHHNGSVRHIAISRPQHRNAINAQAAIELNSAVADFERDDGARVAVLSGTEGTFCAGYDLKEFATSKAIPDIKPVGKGAGPMGPSRLIPKKPTIAAVSGHAVAGT